VNRSCLSIFWLSSFEDWAEQPRQISKMRANVRFKHVTKNRVSIEDNWIISQLLM